jgi:hypothetical protein
LSFVAFVFIISFAVETKLRVLGRSAFYNNQQ